MQKIGSFKKKPYFCDKKRKMLTLFCFIGLFLGFCVGFYILCKIHLHLYTKRWYYLVFDFIALPYYFYLVSQMRQDQAAFFFDCTKGTKNPSTKIVRFFIRKIVCNDRKIKM